MSRRITVVTVVKDDLIGFSRTLQSVTNQISIEFNWVVIDSSSSNLFELVHKNVKSNISTQYEWIPPKGIYHAMNYALSNCISSGWIIFLNAGDVFSNERVIQQIDEDIYRIPGNVKALGYGVNHVSPAGFIWETSLPSVTQTNDPNYLVANINHQGFVAEFYALQKLGFFDSQLSYAADGKLMDALISNNEFILSESIIASFEIGGRSGRNFSEVLREIATYRPAEVLPTRTEFRLNILKNSLRLKVIMICQNLPCVERLILAARKILYK